MKSIANNETLQPINDRIINILVSNHAQFKKFLAKRLPSQAGAEDVLQQSLFRAVEKISTVDFYRGK